MQFLESGEYPVGEIDIDAERIKNFAFKLERQSFAYQQMVVFEASPLTSTLAVIKHGRIKLARVYKMVRVFMLEALVPATQTHRMCWLIELSRENCGKEMISSLLLIGCSIHSCARACLPASTPSWSCPRNRSFPQGRALCYLAH
jgi:hypothetical protein